MMKSLNPAVIGLAGLIILGLSSKIKGSRSLGSLSAPELAILHEHFAIQPGKDIPASYLKNELKRYSILPAVLRSESQQRILSILKKCVT